MPTRLWLRIAEILLTASLAAIVFAAWRADRRDQTQLAADLAAAKQALEQDAARQHDRDAQLLQTLATLAAEKRTISTPAQIIRELPNQILLPAPITLQAPDPTGTPRRTTCSSGPVCGPEGLESAQSRTNPANKTATQAVLPEEDLKPLYDFTLDCKACQDKLSAAQADLTDEQAKTAVLTRERDEAIRAAKGGSLLRRIARNAKWLAIGAAAGAIAAKAHP
jgi:type II secretory pathway pseudopilin PulG